MIGLAAADGGKCVARLVELTACNRRGGQAGGVGQPTADDGPQRRRPIGLTAAANRRDSAVGQIAGAASNVRVLLAGLVVAAAADAAVSPRRSVAPPAADVAGRTGGRV